MENAETFSALSAFSGEREKVDVAVATLEPFVAWHPVARQQMLGHVESKVRQQRFLRDVRQDGEDGWAYLEGLERQLLSLLGEMDTRKQKLAQREKTLEDFNLELEAKLKKLSEDQAALLEAQTQMNAIQNLSTVVNEVASQIDSLKKGYWSENLPEIVDFSLDLTEKIVGDRLVKDPQILVGHIRAILDDIKTGEPIEVHLSPVDYTALIELKSESLQSILQRPEIRFVTDMRLASGDVLLDTDKYRLDASLRTAILNLREDILDNLKKSPVEELPIQNPEEGQTS